MSSSDNDSNEQLSRRLKSVREIEKRLQDDGKSEPELPRWQMVGIGLCCGAVFLFWSVWTGTWPIPRGKENHDKAAAFLKQEFPDQELRPTAEESRTAPVAAVLHII